MLFIALYFVNTIGVTCKDFPGPSKASCYRSAFSIYISGIDDNSAVMTQNTGEQTLFVVFGASVSDSFDIYVDFFRVVILQNFPLAKSAQCLITF